MPVREYGEEAIADKAIAEKAVEKLKDDQKRYQHIMMARCETKSRRCV